MSEEIIISPGLNIFAFITSKPVRHCPTVLKYKGISKEGGKIIGSNQWDLLYSEGLDCQKPAISCGLALR